MVLDEPPKNGIVSTRRSDVPGMHRPEVNFGDGERWSAAWAAGGK